MMKDRYEPEERLPLRVGGSKGHSKRRPWSGLLHFPDGRRTGIGKNIASQGIRASDFGIRISDLAIPFTDKDFS